MGGAFLRGPGRGHLSNSSMRRAAGDPPASGRGRVLSGGRSWILSRIRLESYLQLRDGTHPLGEFSSKPIWHRHGEAKIPWKRLLEIAGNEVEPNIDNKFKILLQLLVELKICRAFMSTDYGKKVIKEMVVRVPVAPDDAGILVAHVAVVLDLHANRHLLELVQPPFKCPKIFAVGVFSLTFRDCGA